MTEDIRKNESDLTTADLAGRAEREEHQKDMVRVRDAAAASSGGAPVRDENLRASTAQTGYVAAGPAAAPARFPKTEERAGPLFATEEAKNYRAQWETVQVGFVDEPRRAVEQADHLVAEAIKRLAEVFADERQKLERQWDKGENVSTEDLRLGLQRYRSFFERLMSV